MSSKQTTVHGWALVGELVLVAVLAGFGPTFPRDVAAGTAWHFLATHGFALSHAVLGTLVLVHTTVLVVAGRARPASLLLALGVVTAVAAGAVYVSGGQPEGALTVMTLGWLVALAMATTELVAARRRTRRLEA